MITDLARQSVILKCKLQKSTMLGNYEFYYAAGLMAQMTGSTGIEKDISPQQLWEKTKKMCETCATEDPYVAHLKFMLEHYKVHEAYDEQMWDLFQCGLQERHLWQVTES